MANIKVTAKKPTQVPYILTVGRRREAIARVRLYPHPTDITWGEHTVNRGDMLVNEQPIGKYFGGDVFRAIYQTPLQLTNSLDKYAFLIKVTGGGKSGQIDAVVHGIARALDKLDSTEYHDTLKKHGLLTRDARARERRKVGMGGKARRKKQSPKR